MGGWGSGRDGGYGKTTVEDTHALDIGRVVRYALRKGACTGSTRWTRGERATGGIAWILETLSDPRTLRLVYRCNGEHVDLPVRLQTTRPHLGGVRYWGTCPLIVNGRPCQRRVAKLYLAAGCRYFGCRTCLDLTYTSCQRSHRFDGLLAQALGIDRKTAGRLARLMGE
jgi:hypothetical protein